MIEFKVNNYDDREKVVMGLINSGYTVRVVNKEVTLLKGDFYV